MAELSGDELNKTVAEVTAEVIREMKKEELKAFTAGDLTQAIKDWGPSSAAWTVTYCTSCGPQAEGDLTQRVKDLGPSSAAWTVTYTTSSSPLAEE